MSEHLIEEKKLKLSTLIIRLLVIASPLLLNDFYLMLLPKNAGRLDLVLDILIYLFWQSTIIYLSFQAGWFSFDDLGIKFDNIKKDIKDGIILLIIIFIIFFIIILFSNFAERIFNIKIKSSSYFSHPKWHPFLVFLYILYLAITAGILEEIIYRGIVITQINKYTENKYFLISGSAILFSLVHWSNGLNTILLSLILGIFWAYLFINKRRLLPLIFAHLIYDFISIYFGLSKIYTKIINDIIGG
jgi:membrane protease YdiL (CAAX protease family)